MKIKALSGDIHSLKRNFRGKRRIMTYGAGELALTIKKLLENHGYQIDCAIVDTWYSNGNIGCRDITVISLEQLYTSYNPELDAVIWAIASPERLRGALEDNQGLECFLIWDVTGFWKEKDYAFIHQKEFQEASGLLHDEISKKIFWAYIEAYRGNIDEDIRYSTDGVYFNELTKEKRNGVFVDCGSYDGQTAIDYMDFIKEDCRVYAFEPDKENYENLVVRMMNYPNVVCLNKGCYSSEKMLSFASSGDMSSCLHETGKELVEVTMIDKVLGDEKAAFIKMDIEGAELEALKGARNVIERDMPVLAISAYHRQEDLITLIPYISNFHSKSEKYNLYLRHHGIVSAELVIYAIPCAYNG